MKIVYLLFIFKIGCHELKKPSHAKVPLRDNEARLKLIHFFIFPGETESFNCYFEEKTVFSIIVQNLKETSWTEIGAWI
jgi:hypothetical protein